MRRSLPVWLLATTLGGCGNDIGVAQVARCDGVLQSGEGKDLDGPFDRDGDGYFDGANDDCVATYPADLLDCDDGNADIHPGATEVCNEADDDCDGLVDGEDDSVDASAGTTFYADADGDGYGDPLLPVAACDPGEGYVENDLDCADGDATVNPGAAEVDCDDLDNDCDEETPDGLDHDADGYTECEDCADLTPGINPGVVETTCNGIDDDCDETTLDGPDADGVRRLQRQRPHDLPRNGGGLRRQHRQRLQRIGGRTVQLRRHL
jgi:hypothetical protein